MIGIGKTNKETKYSYVPVGSQNIKSDFAKINKPQGSGINKSILLNPGPNYYLEPSDQCFYISLGKEENFDWKTIKPKSTKSKKTNYD